MMLNEDNPNTADDDADDAGLRVAYPEEPQPYTEQAQPSHRDASSAKLQTKRSVPTSTTRSAIWARHVL